MVVLVRMSTLSARLSLCLLVGLFLGLSEKLVGAETVNYNDHETGKLNEGLSRTSDIADLDTMNIESNENDFFEPSSEELRALLNEIKAYYIHQREIEAQKSGMTLFEKFKRSNGIKRPFNPQTRWGKRSRPQTR